MLCILGSILGFGSSFLPKILKFLEQKRDQKHELQLMTKQLEIQERLGALKLQEVQAHADIKEIEALHEEQTTMTVASSQWVINLNATVRPLITYCLFVEVAVITVLLAFDIMTESQFDLVWSREFQAIWAAVVSFHFGQRTFSRRS